MFDIGFWEIALIIVVALLVVGPEEFPSLVRNASTWLGKMRRFMSDVKSDLDKELSKAEELKKLLDKEALIAKLHENVDISRPAVSVKSDSDVKFDEAVKSGETVKSDLDGAASKAVVSPTPSGKSKLSHDTQE